MALKKDLIQDNGIKTNYHKIEKIEIFTTEKIMKITVKNYADNIYRKKEKEAQERKKQFVVLQELLDNELKKEIKNEEKIAELAKEINNFIFDEEKTYSINETEILLPFDDEDVSLSSLYVKLKKQSLFSESEDC